MSKNIEERMQDLEKQVNEITETAARLRETFEREQKQTASGVPEIGQHYWYLDECGDVGRAQWDSHRMDKKFLAFGNVYLTEEAAEKARDQKLAEVRVITRLRELDKGFVADWSNEKQTKHSVYFSHTENKFLMELCLVYQACLPHWLSTREAWSQVIQEIPEDIKTMMGVEV